MGVRRCACYVKLVTATSLHVKTQGEDCVNFDEGVARSRGGNDRMRVQNLAFWSLSFQN